MRKVLYIAVMAMGLSGSVYARGGGHSSSHSSYSSHSASSYSSNHTVHGYTRSNGTHVGSYHATNRNATKNDNYSTKGNVNPYTGKAGTKPRDGE
ncbi:hypothetical protein [Collimonas pratensis]|uniref:hypothetical protein n=1 Tax=Collimonas pratensis TaxID=279113 RepID=UPI0009ED7B6E|nr:hypothetical protein [Collimonas pratensis]